MVVGGGRQWNNSEKYLAELVGRHEIDSASVGVGAEGGERPHNTSQFKRIANKPPTWRRSTQRFNTRHWHVLIRDQRRRQGVRSQIWGR